MFGNMMGSISQDQYRLSFDGQIAVRVMTKDGAVYKTYDVNKNKLVTVGDFAIQGLQDTFFLVPTRKLKKGDIVLINGAPVCVISQEGNTIKAVSYTAAEVKTLLVDHILWFGKPFYGKVTSMFKMMLGNGLSGDGDGLMKMMVMSQLFGNGDGLKNIFNFQNDGQGGIGNLLMMSMLFGKGESPLDGLFSMGEDDDDDEEERNVWKTDDIELAEDSEKPQRLCAKDPNNKEARHDRSEKSDRKR